jgi:hypothetical protein
VRLSVQQRPTPLRLGSHGCDTIQSEDPVRRDRRGCVCRACRDHTRHVGGTPYCRESDSRLRGRLAGSAGKTVGPHWAPPPRCPFTGNRPATPAADHDCPVTCLDGGVTNHAGMVSRCLQCRHATEIYVRSTVSTGTNGDPNLQLAYDPVVQVACLAHSGAADPAPAQRFAHRPCFHSATYLGSRREPLPVDHRR